MTQKELAERLGLHEHTIGSWVKGQKEPGLLKSYKMCFWLNCDLHWLITGHIHPAYNKDYVSDTGKFLVQEYQQKYIVVNGNSEKDAELFAKLKNLKPEYKKTIEELIELYAKKET